MTEKEMSTGSVSLDKERLLKYKIYSSALAYPGENFFSYFPGLKDERGKVIEEYDKLFRKSDIWLYTLEYTAKGEFQKMNCLSDIMGFYKAFSLEPHEDRPDSLSIEFEFMHFLIFKRIYALENKLEDFREKASMCASTQSKFFNEYLYPGAKAVAEKVIAVENDGIYFEVASQMLGFLADEKRLLKNF